MLLPIATRDTWGERSVSEVEGSGGWVRYEEEPFWEEAFVGWEVGLDC
jgi:hypothetical protein